MGFVKLPDDLKEWAWYDDNIALLIYIRLRFAAKYKAADVGTVHLERGQVLTSIREIAETNGVSIQQARTALERLKSTNKTAIRSTPQYSIITLLDYDCDTENNMQSNTPTTSKQHTEQQTNNIPTTNEQQTSNTPSLLTSDKQIYKQQTTRACAREGGSAEKGDCESSFKRFWAAYPKKTSKRQALKAWEKMWRELKPDKALIDIILSSLEQQKQSAQWTKDDGQFIPYPATWLNGRRWEDKPTEPLSGNNGTCYGHESSFDVGEIMRRARKKYDGSGSMIDSSFDVDEVMRQVIESYQEPQADKEDT